MVPIVKKAILLLRQVKVNRGSFRIDIILTNKDLSLICISFIGCGLFTLFFFCFGDVLEKNLFGEKSNAMNIKKTLKASNSKERIHYIMLK